jgi:hypothetical protein
MEWLIAAIIVAWFGLMLGLAMYTRVVRENRELKAKLRGVARLYGLEPTGHVVIGTAAERIDPGDAVLWSSDTNTFYRMSKMPEVNKPRSCRETAKVE